MVEKVSEVSMSVAMKGDSTPDDNALLKNIAKKKKQDEGGENISLAAMLPPGALVRLTTPLAQGEACRKPKSRRQKKSLPPLWALPPKHARPRRAMACVGWLRWSLLARWLRRTQAKTPSSSKKARSPAR